MAIDTAEKRKSISGMPFLIPGVTPNASKDGEWRQESGWSYSGISVSGEVTTPTIYRQVLGFPRRVVYPQLV